MSSARAPGRRAVAIGLIAVHLLLAVAVLPPTTPLRAEADTDPADVRPAPRQPFVQEIPGTTLAFDLVPIPGGTVRMGSPDAEEKRGRDEGPLAEVAVDPFYMGRHEVTWDVYNEFLQQYNLLGSGQAAVVPYEQQADAVSYPTPIYDIEVGPALQRMGGREGKLPAVIMSHFATKQFTKWLSAKTGRFYRLPTEAEWEHAARGGTRTAYFFGDDPRRLAEYAWFFDNSELPDGDPGYREVGRKKPNPYGLYDIYGNVAEFVIDQYETDYQRLAGRPVGWRDAVRWPDAMFPRVARGGGYESEAGELRSAARHRITRTINSRDPCSPKSPYWWTEGFAIGFRVVCPDREPSPEEKHRFWDVDNDADRKVLKRDREIRQLTDELKPRATRPAGSGRPAVP